MEFRKMVETDIDSVLAIENDIFGEDAWSREMYESELDFNEMWVLEASNGDIISFAGGYQVLDEFSISNVGTSSKYHRKGYAEQILINVFGIMINRGVRSFFLEVRESNIPAQKLYEKMHFKTIGIRKNYYRKPKEHAYVMAWQLDNELA